MEYEKGMESKKREYIGMEQAISKIRQYCSYQERCHFEVRERLFEMGMYPNQIDEIVSGLITENYLNEERFAIQFAGGKFRMKNWGKIKIAHALKLKRVSPYLIQVALGSINEAEYQVLFNKLANEKWKALKREKNVFTKKAKLRNFLLQRGFESPLIIEYLNLI